MKNTKPNTKLDNLFSAIIPLMKSIGGESIFVQYNGSGDCGSAEFQNVLDKNTFVIDESKYCDLTTKYNKPVSRWDNGWIEEIKETEANLVELAEEITYEMLLNHASGWEINAGSYGELDISLDPPTARLSYTPCEDEEDENGDTETVDGEEEIYFYSPPVEPVKAKKPTKKVSKKKA